MRLNGGEMTGITNLQTKAVIHLPYDLYPIDDLDWSPLTASAVYTLSGAYVVQQSVKKAGKPITLQSDSNQGLGLVTRDVVNKLHEACAMPDATFKLEYVADGTIKAVNVMFDHTQTPIKAVPAKGFNSPKLDDWFAVTVRLVVV